MRTNTRFLCFLITTALSVSVFQSPGLSWQPRPEPHGHLPSVAMEDGAHHAALRSPELSFLAQGSPRQEEAARLFIQAFDRVDQGQLRAIDVT